MTAMKWLALPIIALALALVGWLLATWSEPTDGELQLMIDRESARRRDAWMAANEYDPQQTEDP